MIAPRVSARANGHEAIETISICHSTTGTREIRIERRIMLITLMKVAPGGIGLPHLDQSFRDGTTVFIHHSTAHQDALTDRLASMLPS
jgi:hypothetical protein